MSDSLRYEGRVPDSTGIVEGKFDRVGDREVLVTTGTFGFRTYDVRPVDPLLLDTFQPPEILGANGYWQDEDMELDVRRKLIIGALDPRHDDVDQASCPGIGTLGRRTAIPIAARASTSSRTRTPTNLKQIGDFVELPAGHTTSCVESCHSSGPAGRRGATTRRGSGRSRPAARGDGRPIWVTDLKDPAHPEVIPSRSTWAATTA